LSDLDPKTTALLVVDVQKAFEEWDAAGLRRNNPDASERISNLLAVFRTRGASVIHIRHASLNPDSAFRADRPGHQVQDVAREEPGEPIVVKNVNSSFIGTDLENRLRASGIENLVIVGATTNHCVETTARMAGNLGFNTLLVRDATWTYDRVGVDGELFSAEQIHAVTLANLNDEFAEVASAEEVASRLG
jgi:nicotinamidase-related amidase